MENLYIIEYWQRSAEQDLDTAEILFQHSRYDWCLFIGHLVIEKMLKAVYIRDTNESPPRIHNLLRLAEPTILQLSDEQKQLMMDITRFNIETRYPDYKQTFQKLCTKEFAEDYFIKIKELYAWLKSHIVR
jgi:HEPN domain-containing protein